MYNITVTLYKRKDTGIWIMQYRQPGADGKVRRTTKQKHRHKAETIRAKWEAELRAGKDSRKGFMPWADFRRRYEDEQLTSLAEKTDEKVNAVFNVFERLMKPRQLGSIDTGTISRYQAKLRKAKRSEQTIKSHLAHLQAALNWGIEQGMLATVPTFKMPNRAKASKVMRGRPITTEEFERMLAKVESVVTDGMANNADKKVDVVQSWKFYLTGLWWSGLRRTESLQLHWTDDTKILVVGLDGASPAMNIPSEHQKSNENEVAPMAPEFAEYLRAVPEDQREGFVFNPLPRRNKSTSRITSAFVGKVVSSIGEAAGVIVDAKSGKHASCHDLRRSFGARWALRVMPMALRGLMRHKDIKTTDKFYVEHDAASLSSELWRAFNSVSSLGSIPGSIVENANEKEKCDKS